MPSLTYRFKTQAAQTQYRFVAAAPLQIEQEYENARNSGAVADIIAENEVIVQKGTTYTGTFEGGTPLPAPTAPILAGMVMSNTSVRLIFSKLLNSLDASYQPKYKTVGGVYQDFGSAIANSPVLVTGLTEGTLYIFKVSAVNDSGSADSNEITITTNPEPDAISALITQDIVTAEAAVTIFNGYNTDVAYCEQERLTDRKNDRYPMVTVAGPYQTFDSDSHSRGTKDTLDYTLFYEAELNDMDLVNDDPIAKQARNIAADLIKGFMVDRTRGGYAIITNPKEAFYTVDFTNNDEPIFIVVVTLEVETILDNINPYQNG